MALFSRAELDDAVQIVHANMNPTPAYTWPLLAQRTGVDIVVKHENHTPTGSFKARGGLVYVQRLSQRGVTAKGLVTATRGNHGQSVAIGAAKAGMAAAIVVPEGNSVEKNAAMAAFGGEIIIAGRDFDECRKIATKLGQQRDYLFVPSFHPDIVAGVACYALELFNSHNQLDAVFVPIGMGSGICGLITVRDMLGLKTDIIGVVAEKAPAFSLSIEAGYPVSTQSADTFADGMACRDPQPDAFDIVKSGAAEIVQVSEDEIAQAIRAYYTDTHNLAEGAGAASLAALIKLKKKFTGKKAGVILTGGNIDMDVFARILNQPTQSV